MGERLKASSRLEVIKSAPVYENQLRYPITGEYKFVIRKGQPWPVKLQDGNYLYVVLPSGEIRITMHPRPISKMHHPELVGGQGVIAAGIIRTENDKVSFMSNESGHYCPDADSVTYARMAFELWDIPMTDSVAFDTSWICK